MKNIRAVIVENDEDEQMFIREGFESSGVPVEIIAMFDNGDQLIAWLQSQQEQLPDIVISDLNMPGRNGYDILQEMRDNKAWSHIPVIITSTSSTKAIMEKCLALGALDYLVKPDTFTGYADYAKRFYEKIQPKLDA
jgi:CheY-like chemotaxis protein